MSQKKPKTSYFQLAYELTHLAGIAVGYTIGKGISWTSKALRKLRTK